MAAYNKCKQIIKIVLGIRLNQKDYVDIGRLLTKKRGLEKRILERRYYQTGQKFGLEIGGFSGIGDNLVLAHPFNITINSKARIGANCVVFKGVTIGSIRSGKRSGCPRLGDNVVIGPNSTVCGGITIGNDVLIAANTFVDFDVPDHSIVIGSPGTIHLKENATLDYRNLIGG